MAEEIPEINVETLGFKALAHGLEGAKKVKLLPEPWSDTNVPPACATLLSIAPKRGLLIAAGPEILVVASTKSVRQAFGKETGEKDVVSEFSPDSTFPVAPLRHVAFSADEDLLVLSSEREGGLAVYEVDTFLKLNREPQVQVSTDNIPIRSLLLNPNPALSQYAAIVLDSGRMTIIDITKNEAIAVRDEGATCAAWSAKGKALIVGLQDGSAALYKGDYSEQVGTIPRPTEVSAGSFVSSIYWLTNSDIFLTFSSSGETTSSDDDTQEDDFYFVRVDKNFIPVEYRKSPFSFLFPAMSGDAPYRKPPTRFSINRLRDWKPALDDLLILAGSNSSDVAMLIKSSEKLSQEHDALTEFQLTSLIDSRKAQVPRTSLRDDMESVLIGEALDLSSEEKVARPSPRLEEVTESSTPLPAYFLLTHEGILAAWWVVWDDSVASGTGYAGLVTSIEGSESKVDDKSSVPEHSSVRNASKLSLGAPATPAFSSMGSQAIAPAFGKPAFGQPSFGSKTQPAFGAATPVGPSMTATFGTPSQSARPSPWAANKPTAEHQTSANPFARAAANGSGFAIMGTSKPAGSAFSSFGSVDGGPSAFSGLGKQKSAFGGSSSSFKGLSTEPSFGSTVDLGSGTGSTLPSWTNTPAQQGGSIFGQAVDSSFGSSKESDMSGTDDGTNRERDEATPTPQIQPAQAKNLFGLANGGFKLGSTFKADSSPRSEAEVAPGALGSSFLGTAFGSSLEDTKSQNPITPSKPALAESSDPSTTPATRPKAAGGFFGDIKPAANSQPQESRQKYSPDDAPLPPDFATWKPPKSDDDLPPLAGSPPIKVEAPSSSVSSSPLEDDGEDGDISVEEESDEDGGAVNTSPVQPARSNQPPQARWKLQDSTDRSPRIFPAAPTPPPARNGMPAFAQPSIPSPSPFAQPSKASPLSFEQPSSEAVPTIEGSPKAPRSFAATGRTHGTFRSPHSIGSAPMSAMGESRRGPVPSSTLASKSHVAQPADPSLVDDEDDRIVEELASDIKPSRKLDRFLARQEYGGGENGKSGHAAQIEIVYRDINSMVNTLGLNSRSLAGFLQYHEHAKRQSSLTLGTLEDIIDAGEDDPWFEPWSLSEIDDLKNLEDQLEQLLDEGRLQDVIGRLTQVSRLGGENAKVYTKLNDIRRLIIQRKDPAKAEAMRKALLPKELAEQQKVLRQEYARLVTSLSEAEEAIMFLRSRLASHEVEKGRNTAVPTVDAVKKTIAKLTMITEKKSNEITLLEAQLRKIGLSQSIRAGSPNTRQPVTPSQHSRKSGVNEAFSTPPTSRHQISIDELHRRVLTPEATALRTDGYGLYFTPNGSPSGGANLSAICDMVEDNLPALRQTARRRRTVADGLAAALLERGVKVTHVK